MTAAVLYIAVDCESVSAAQTMLRRFMEAGLNTEHPTVHVAIGDATTGRTDHGTGVTGDLSRESRG